ncbi:MAG: cellulose biosynthesis protein CelD, partial [Deltaproteobacteria bacterium]|nr:cellulose biosynthesis protein CelD [Deltaproteobacteria bacterium]
DLVDPADPYVEAIWRALEHRSPPAYFLSWGWIENWLACIPKRHLPPLAVISSDGVATAAAFLARRTLVRHHMLPSRAAFLNTTGIPRFDDLQIEHNSLLGTADLATLVELVPGDWDELILPGVSASAFAAISSETYHVRIDRAVPSPFVDLERVRSSAGGYLALLDAHTRAQIRRARRGVSDLAIEHATNVEQARAIYDELVELHGASWRARGQPGAFADPWFDMFHRRLIDGRFGAGEIELMRVTARGRTLGCLYNFVSHGKVLFYQSGFAHEDDPRIKLGFLCHAAAIEDAARAGHVTYDFLGGDARYKHSLATNEVRLVWGRVQRPLARFAIEDRLRSWKHALRSLHLLG